ncbi:MAG: phage tail protein [Desulfobacteraceae bacterium]|jgi:hypothetical protein
METNRSNFIEQQLWRLFPEVYRNRDNGHLAKYIACCSDLLEQIYATLRQRHRDAFPQSCQTWLIPYFAQLLDVQLMSPSAQGQRKEVANAVAWHQRKGTAGCVEQIAQDVGQMEVEIQEGLRRVAVTQRLNMPLLPVDALGQKKAPDMNNPLEAVKHPGLETVFVDFRRASRARQADQETAITHETRFGSETVLWHQVHPGGVPCFPDHYEDVSKRTVDLRDPGYGKGLYHPKRVMLFTPPPAGFFPPDQQSIDWLDRLAMDDPNPFEQIKVDDWEDDGVKITERVYQVPATADRFAEVERHEELNDGTVKITRIFKGVDPASPLRINGDVEFRDQPESGRETVYRFENLYLSDSVTVKYGRLETERTAAFRLWVQNADKTVPVLTARDSLIEQIRVAKGLCQLEYCTVLGRMTIEKLQASDCILLEYFEKDLETPPLSRVVCVRYSALAHGLSTISGAFRCTEKPPIFYSQTLGDYGCGVLTPTAPRQICFGSEDGSEMGAFHHRHYSIGTIAVTDKLEDFLPVGIVPVIIPDQRLRVPPP